jgi:flagellar motility protein MotE (MotC chaperone)
MAKPPIRILPILLGAIALMITVKVGALWHDIALTAGTQAAAQTQQPAANAPAANAPAANPPPANAPAASAAPANPAVPPPPAANPATAPQQAAQTPAANAPAANAPAANAPAGSATTPSTAGQPTAAPAPGAPADATTAQTPDSAPAVDPFNYTDQEVTVLQQLSKRRTELDARARQLDEREALVAAAEQRMDQKMAELKAMQSTLQDLLKQRSAAEEAQLLSLVKIYENMKPQAAAGVFEELDMDILLEVVSRMKERKVAPILALMTPTRAKELTFELAQRQQLPVAP